MEQTSGEDAPGGGMGSGSSTRGQEPERATGRWRRAGRLMLRFCGIFLLAGAGGVLGAVAYSQAVDRPGAMDVMQRHQALEMVIPPPLAGAPGGQAIDPLRQALEVVKGGLPAGALLKVEATLRGGAVRLTGEVDSLRTLARAAHALGDLGGVETVDTRAVTLADRSHVIVPGDQPAIISRRYYGHSCGWRQIVAANPSLDLSNLRVGKTLIIPSRDR